MAIIKTKFSRGVEGTTNIVDAGTEGTKVASGTTAQRGSTAGQIRFNSTNNLAEYYNGTSFKQIDSPPTVSSIDVTEVDSQAGGNQTIVITGSGFASGATVTFVGASGTNFNASTVTVDSLTQITAVAPKASFLNAQEPYGVKVTNVSGLSNTLASQINVDTAPSWSTSSGSLGSFNNYSTINVSATATDSDGDTVSYSVQSGSIPAGLSLNSSTGAITGTPTAVTNSTTSSFTLRATAGSKTADRPFTITVNPIIEQFTSNGTWTVPSGISQVAILVVAGGGAGGTTDGSGYINAVNRGGAGGAGGAILITNYNVSGASSYSVNIGSGGTVGTNSATKGSNTTFSGGSKTLTGLGGGSGGWGDNLNNATSGGSGGSGWYSGYTGKSGTQPTNTSDGVNTYNSTGYGQAGGDSSNVQPYAGGGGGAGSRGMHATEASSGTTTTDSQGNSLTGDTGDAIGGTGLYIGSIFGTSYGEQGFVASGGTGAGYNGNSESANSVSTKAHLGGGGIGYNASTNTPSNAQANGQANTGGGGGSGGNGGSGLVLIKY